MTDHIPCPACGLRYPAHTFQVLPQAYRCAWDSDRPVCPACHYFATRPGVTPRRFARWLSMFPIIEAVAIVAGVVCIGIAVARWIGGGA